MIIERNTSLHYWYLNEIQNDIGDSFVVAHGIVTGHAKIEDAVFIHTSEVQKVSVDDKACELILQTRNTEYRCPLAYCDWDEQDKMPTIIPEYAYIKENYKGKLCEKTIDDGKILLVISNFDEYYFHSIYYKSVDSDEKMEFIATPHIGYSKDSFLIFGSGFDIRYFPQNQNIEFYVESVNDTPFFVENIGDIILYVKSSKGVVKLAPGECKEIIKENAELDPPLLSRRELYPVLYDI